MSKSKAHPVYLKVHVNRIEDDEKARALWMKIDEKWLKSTSGVSDEIQVQNIYRGYIQWERCYGRNLQKARSYIDRRLKHLNKLRKAKSTNKRKRDQITDSTSGKPDNK